VSDALVGTITATVPSDVSEERLAEWALAAAATADDEVRYARLEALAELTAHTRFARFMIAEWTGLPDPEVQRAGWLTLVRLAHVDEEAAPEYFEAYLQRIETEMLHVGDGLQHAMAEAVVAIASRDPELEEYAAQIASRLLGE